MNGYGFLHKLNRKKSEKNDIYILNKNLSISINSLIDIGGSDGNMTEEITNFYKIKNSSTLIVDPIKIKSRFKTITPSEFLLIDDQIDMISCMMSIHHFMGNFDIMFKKIFQTIKLNGYLLIKEHDVLDDITEDFLNNVHYIYAKFNNNNDYSTAETNYFSKKDLEKFIISNGFELINSYSNILYNPQKKYHSIFKKINNIDYNVIYRTVSDHLDIWNINYLNDEFLLKLLKHYTNDGIDYDKFILSIRNKYFKIFLSEFKGKKHKI